MIKLGDKACDLISGWEGIATAYYVYLNGCVRWELSGKNDKGEPEAYVFDEHHVGVLEDRKIAPALGIPDSPSDPVLSSRQPVSVEDSDIPARTGGSRDNRPVER